VAVFLFLLVPLIEIALFIQVGGWFGLWPTLGIVVATAVAGPILVRSQGSQALNGFAAASMIARSHGNLAHGAMILFSGALLLTPGFFTDAVGFALLVPGCPQSFICGGSRNASKMQYVSSGNPIGGRPIRSTMISSRVNTKCRTGPAGWPSGWTRH
jgi:UPF0716 protein FxsA